MCYTKVESEKTRSGSGGVDPDGSADSSQRAQQISNADIQQRYYSWKGQTVEVIVIMWDPVCLLAGFRSSFSRFYMGPGPIFQMVDGSSLALLVVRFQVLLGSSTNVWTRENL